jgi:hypothetical protein
MITGYHGLYSINGNKIYSSGMSGIPKCPHCGAILECTGHKCEKDYIQIFIPDYSTTATKLKLVHTHEVRRIQ